MQTGQLSPKAPPLPAAGGYARGMRVFTIAKGIVRADEPLRNATARFDAGHLTDRFVQLLAQPAAFAGYVGQRMRLDGMPPFTVDWLMLSGCNCFATFACDLPAITDFLLVMSRVQRGRDDANLSWFMERVAGGFGSRVEADSLRQVRVWPAPAAVRFSLNPRPAADPINLAQQCFCEAFARILADF